MLNKELLKKKISSKGLKLSYIADKLSLTRFGLAKKINKDTEFKASEIVTMVELLDLSLEEKEKIFFNK